MLNSGKVVSMVNTPVDRKSASEMMAIVNDTMRESWEITLFTYWPKAHCFNSGMLESHWQNQAHHVSQLVDKIGEIGHHGLDDDEHAELILEVWKLLKCELDFQSKLQQELEEYFTEDYVDFLSFPAFADMLQFLHSTQAAIAARLRDLYRVYASIHFNDTAEVPDLVSAAS